MCGIFGCAPRTPLTESLLPYLAWAMEDRGDDSWGVTDGTPDNILKKLGPITDSFEVPEWDTLIYHTRNASCGEKTIENQHPFVFEKADGTHVVGVHNGIVSNHTELKKKYPERENFSVDSMHIFAHIAQRKDMGEISGWGAMVWGEDYTTFFGRFNMDSLHVWKLSTGEIVFCSTRIIKKALGLARARGVTATEYNIVGDKKYWLDWKEDKGYILTESADPFRFGFRGYYSQGQCARTGVSFQGSGAASSSGITPRGSYYYYGENDDGATPWEFHNQRIARLAEEGRRRAVESIIDRTVVQESKTADGSAVVAISSGGQQGGTSSTAVVERKHVGSHTARRRNANEWVCMRCRQRVVKDPKKEIVCSQCFGMFEDRFSRERWLVSGAGR